MEVEASNRVSWGGMRSSRTQAVPRHSLFGTALENVDREQLKEIEGRYVPEGLVKKSPNRYPLPSYIKDNIPGRENVQTSQKRLATQQDALSQADNELKTKHTKAFTFQPDSNPNASHTGVHSNRPNWLTEKDLEHSKDINILGLNEHGSYNRDKYGKKPQVHNYSLIGDVLAPKMDFNSARNVEEESKPQGVKTNVAWGPGRHLPHELMEKQQKESKSKKKNLAKSVIDLPPNIRHLFGSRVCDSLLSDHAIVSLALERQKSKMGPLRPSKIQNIEGLPVDLGNTYESLGHTTRHNVCPGVSSGHLISRTKDEFNDEVHQRRVPNTDEFRYQRDELSIWVEQDVLRKRMQDKWKHYYDQMPKAVANWDRNAKRPQTTAPPVPKPPAKPKPRPQKPKMSKESPPVDDDMNIVFVTPPLTPPIPEPEHVQLPKAFEKDDEFWSFYDQA